MIFLRQHINSVSRQVLWRNKSNLLPKHSNRYEKYFFVWKRSLFGRCNFSKFKFKTWRFYTRLFFLLFRKIVIVLLKCRLSTLRMTIFIYGGYKRIGGIWGPSLYERVFILEKILRLIRIFFHYLISSWSPPNIMCFK